MNRRRRRRGKIRRRRRRGRKRKKEREKEEEEAEEEEEGEEEEEEEDAVECDIMKRRRIKTLKAHFYSFNYLPTARQTVSNMHEHVTTDQCVNHVQVSTFASAIGYSKAVPTDIFISRRQTSKSKKKLSQVS